MNIDKYLNINHTDFFQSTKRTVLLYGSASSGKSYSAVDKLILMSLIYKKPIKSIIIRKTLPSLKRSVLDILIKRLNLFGIPYELNQQNMTINMPYGSKIIMTSVNHYTEIEKLKSITDLDFAFVEEATEILEDAFDQLHLRLRGGELNWKQCILTFNPINTNNWIYKRFFEKTQEDTDIFHKNYQQNPWVDNGFVKQLESLKDINPNLYKVYAEGKWGSLEGTIFQNYEIVDSYPEGIKEEVIGIDFGFNAPTGIVKVSYTDNPNEIYVEELLYESKLTNTELINKLNNLNIKDKLIIPDSAEPARIEELRKNGFRVREANKDVQAGIQYLQTLKIKVISNSFNLIKEIESYSWQKDKNGNYIDVPVKFMDHLIDPLRYVTYTNKKKMIANPIGADGNISNILGDLFMRQQFSSNMRL